MAAAIGDFAPDVSVATFPSWETLPHERLSPSFDTVGRRTHLLRRIAHADPQDPLLLPVDVVVASVRAVVQPISSSVVETAPVRVRAGDRVDLTACVEALVGLGYERVDLVERRGQVAVRGGTWTSFRRGEARRPHRVPKDDVGNWHSRSPINDPLLEHGLLAPAVRERLLTDGVRAKARELAIGAPGIAEMCHKIAAGIPVEGMESLTALLDASMVTLVDLLPRGTQIVVSEPERVAARASDVMRTAQEFLEAGWHSAAVGADVPIDIEPAAYRTLDQVHDNAGARGCRWWTLNPLPSIDPDVDLGAGAPREYRGDSEEAFADIRGWLAEGRNVTDG